MPGRNLNARPKRKSAGGRAQQMGQIGPGAHRQHNERGGVYLRSDPPRIYSQKRRSLSPAAIAIIVVIALALVGAGAYALFGAGFKKQSAREKNVSIESSATTAAAASTKKPAAKSSPAPVRKVRPAVSFAAVGDLCFMDSSHHSLGSAASLLSSMQSQLSAPDLTIGNLEIALTSAGTPQDKTYTFRAPPSSAADMAQAGIDVVSLANNHALDYGRDQLPGELTALQQAGLVSVGGGLNKQEAWAPKTIERNGAKVGFFAFSEITPSEFAATDTEPGVAYTQDASAMTAAVAAAKASGAYDYLVVIMHWGIEGDYQENDRQDTEGHALIDAGADAVIGSHPHRIQGVEYYKGKLIAYSLGNFVFGTFKEASCQTMMLNFKLTDTGVEAVTATPVYINRGTPQVATGTRQEKIAAIIKSSSEHCGTQVTFDSNGTATFVKPQ